jgi:ribonuclease D
MFDHAVEFIQQPEQLTLLAERALNAKALALDIETVNWWDRQREQVALLQLAFRTADKTEVAIVDTLALRDLEALRRPLELSLSTKAIHNASYDAVRLQRHYGIAVSPIHDTMLAARRSGDKKCSLKAQASSRLGIELDKTEQRSDWSRRPLNDEQLHYASLDAVATLMLYEQQLARGLRGDYELRERAPVSDTPQWQVVPLIADNETTIEMRALQAGELDQASLAMLGVIAELHGRYSPEQLAASVGSERIGLAGWIMDQTLGTEIDVDETSARQIIADLCATGLTHISVTRRLEATKAGAQRWQDYKANW